MQKTVFVLCFLALAAPSVASDDLYAKISAKLASDPALAARLGKPGPEMGSLHWMIGTWDVVAEVQAGEKPRVPERGVSVVTTVLDGTALQIADHYPKGAQDLGFISYSPATRLWTAINLDSLANVAVTTSRDAAVFTGDVTIVGVRTTLRQTMKHESKTSYTITNAERMADGNWRVLDVYRYRKR